MNHRNPNLNWDLVNIYSSGDHSLFPAVVQKEENTHPGTRQKLDIL